MIDSKIEYDVSKDAEYVGLLADQSHRNRVAENLVRESLDSSVMDSGVVVVELFNGDAPINRITFDVVTNPVQLIIVRSEFFMTPPVVDELGNIINYGGITL